jgi:hypothetical protein
VAITAYVSLNPVSGAALNAKGAYVQVVGSSPYASSRLWLIAEFSSTGIQRWYLIDIATGAAGAETVVVANLAVQCDMDQIASAFIPLNVDIPAGTRIAIRTQCGATTSGITVHVYLDNRAIASLANPATYGADTTTSRGTVIDPGGTANTKGSYVQLSASTSSRIDAAVLCVTHDSSVSEITTGLRWAIDIATGAAGAETIVIPNITIAGNAVARSTRPGVMYFPVSIPAGTRVAARCNCNVNTSTIRKICVTLIGLQEPAGAGGGVSASAVAYVG